MSSEQTASIGRHPTNPDAGWLSLMAEIYATRRGLYFSRRKRFDEALRPKTSNGSVIAYPDAIYHLTQADLDRAKATIGEL